MLVFLAKLKKGWTCVAHIRNEIYLSMTRYSRYGNALKLHTTLSSSSQSPNTIRIQPEQSTLPCTIAKLNADIPVFDW